MAAPPASTVPTTTTQTTPSDAMVHHKPSAGTTQDSSTSTTNPPAPPLDTYESSKASSVYRQAKESLNQGDYETALSLIQHDGLEAQLERLMAATTNGTMTLDEASLHPSLAPFHYLYGTTLLYSMEEQQPDDPVQQQEQEESVPEEQEDPDDNGAEQNVRDMVFVMPSHSQPPQAQEAPPEEDVDDLQIAYEHLDTSRLLLQSYIQEKQEQQQEQPHNKDALQSLSLDLAQIWLRQGDLQRLNGQYQQAVDNYQSCLTLRQQQASENTTTTTTPRSLADVHYQLALTYSLLVGHESTRGDDATTAKEEDESEAKPAAAAAAAAVVPTDEDQEPIVSPAQLHEWRQASLQHYATCAQLLTQHACSALGGSSTTERTLPVLPNVLVPHDNKTTKDDQKVSSSSSSAGATPTTQEVWQQARSHVQALRDHVLQTHSTANHDTDNDKDDSVLELLNDIQEIVNEALVSEEGLHQVTALKSEITAAAAATVAAAAVPDDPDSVPSAEESPSVAFGSATATALSATAQTTLMVRSKRKAPPPSSTNDAATSKKPKPATE